MKRTDYNRIISWPETTFSVLGEGDLCYSIAVTVASQW